MPKCKKCKSNFPYRIKVDGVIRNLKSRSYCLKCSPFKSKQGYEHRKDRSNRSKTKICPICEREFGWTKNNVCSSCRSSNMREKNKIALINMLGGSCVECGISDIRVLDFHHIQDKKFTISSRLECSIVDLKQEAEKCVLLCANCHRIEHNKDKEDVLDYYDQLSFPRGVK